MADLKKVHFSKSPILKIHEGKKPTAKCHIEKVYQHHFGQDYTITSIWSLLQMTWFLHEPTSCYSWTDPCIILSWTTGVIVSLVHEWKKPTAKCHIEKVYQHHFGQDYTITSIWSLLQTTWFLHEPTLCCPFINRSVHYPFMNNRSHCFLGSWMKKANCFN